MTPTLNEEAHILETVRCLQSQRLDQDVEFLFMDGRSEDATRSMLQRLAADDPRIRILDNPERGIPFALNIGLETSDAQDPCERIHPEPDREPVVLTPVEPAEAVAPVAVVPVAVVPVALTTAGDTIIVTVEIDVAPAPMEIPE